MKLIQSTLLFLICSYTGYAQNTDSLMNAFNPEKKVATISINKQIELNTKDTINPDYNVIDGKRWLFEYSFKSKEYIQIADDEYSEKLLFNILPKKNSFKITSKDFDKINLLYTQSCFCMDAGTYLISNGVLNGKKINANTWQLTINFNYVGRRSNTKVNKELKINYTVK